MNYAELHCHSYYSFHDGAASLEELLLRAKELGYRALAITDHDNLGGVMRFAQLASPLEMKGIIGAEITLRGGAHLTLLAQDRTGYGNLCRLITAAHAAGERHDPELPPELLLQHADGLIALSGGQAGDIGQALLAGHPDLARECLAFWRDLFPCSFYLELQRTGREGDEHHLHAAVELAAVELLPLEPPRVVAVPGRILLARLLAPGREGAVRPVEHGAPALAVGPDAVEIVGGGGLADLRDHQLIDVGAEGARRSRIAVALGVHGRPLGMLLDGHLVVATPSKPRLQTLKPDSLGPPLRRDQEPTPQPAKRANSREPGNRREWRRE